MQKITFDSNVFQPVVRPDKFPNDKEPTALASIHVTRAIGPRAETAMATAEACPVAIPPAAFVVRG